MDRRTFIKLTSATGAAMALAKLEAAQVVEAQQPAPAAPKQGADHKHLDAMNKYAELTGGAKLTIGMLIYPGMFLQDLVGPLAMFESLLNREIHLLWKNLEPVGNETAETKTLIPVKPTTSFKDCPEHLDVLFVPGGVPGTLTMMEDPEVLKLLAEKGKTARYVTSVCTGSLILGAAGLLKGYRATSHWVTLDVLKELGAIPSKSRIVIDRNRITGGGVTAGLDFGLKLVALLRNETYAKAVQLYLEYNPQPPFNAGTPEKAPPVAKQFLDEMFAGLKDASRQTAIRARTRS